MAFPALNAALLKSGHQFPADVAWAVGKKLPEKVLQFGEGNFLRGFVDWMIHRLNTMGLFNGSVVVVQPIAQGLAEKLNEQDGLYTLLLRGIQNGKVVEEKEIISAVSRGINPYADFAGYLQTAENPDLRVIVSNTTEAGIAFSAADKQTDAPPASFPGKLTLLLHKRFTHFKGDVKKGFILLPCELIERNGDNLKKAVLQTAQHWNLEPAFAAWVEQANIFCNTLVDRIVTGYPRDEATQITEKLGYQDALIDTAEVFHFWAIEATGTDMKKLSEEVPFAKAGLDVVWTDNMTPYRNRKVRILNGAHTMTVLAAYLAGKNTVRECMDDPLISSYMQNGISAEIIPTLDLPKQELEAFAAAVSERFANPFIQHYLLSISLNSTSKYKARILASVQEYAKRKGKLPARLTFALAALIVFYRGTEIRDAALIGHRDSAEYKIQDDLPALEMFKAAWSRFENSPAGADKLVHGVLANSAIWGTDLNTIPGFTRAVAGHVHAIVSRGVVPAMQAANA